MNILNNIKSPKELLNYQSQNITYGFLGKNGKKYLDMFSKEWDDWYSQCYVQNGIEVLESKVGTCWDQVELERLWFESNDYKFSTFFIYFAVNRENNYPTHTFLIYENNNKYYWYENSFEAERGIHEFNTIDEAIECVKSKHIMYTKSRFVNMPIDDINCLTVCEYFKPANHLGVIEYLNHVTSFEYKVKNNTN